MHLYNQIIETCQSSIRVKKRLMKYVFKDNYFKRIETLPFICIKNIIL